MRFRFIGILIILSLSLSSLYAQRDSTAFRIHFRTGSMTVEAGYSDNAERVSFISEYLQNLHADSTRTLAGIVLNGSASLEGSLDFNTALAEGRLAALEKIAVDVGIPDSLITRHVFNIPWRSLESIVDSSSLSDKDRILRIIQEDIPDTDKLTQLRNMDNGKVWQWMYDNCFSSLRYASVVFITEEGRQPCPISSVSQPKGGGYSRIADLP